MELLALLTTLYHRKGTVLLSVCAFLGVALLANAVLPEQFTAETQVIVEGDDSTTSLLNDLGLAEMAKSLSTASDDIQNKIYLATSKPVMDEVIWRMQLRKGDGSLYEAEDVSDAGLLAPVVGAPSIEVTQTTGTDVLVIEATGPTPEAARLMADTLADVYIDQQTEQARAEYAAAQRFVQERLGVVTQELDTAYAGFAELQRGTAIIDLDAEQRSAVTRLSDLTMQRELVFGQIKETQSKLASAQAFNARESVDGVSSQTLTTNPIVGKLKGQLAELATQRQSLLLDGFTERAPEIVEIDAKTAAVKRELGTALASQQDLDPAVAELQADLAGLLERQRALTDAIDRTQAAGADYPDLRRQFSQLQLRAEAAEEVYRSLQDQAYQLGIAEAMTMSDLRIVARAELPDEASSPKPVLNVAAGLLLGLVFGLASALLLAYVDDTVRDADDLRSTWDLPSLGAVPRKRRLDPAALARLPAADPFVEAHRAIRSALEFASLDKPLAVIGVTSSVPGEGKSTLAHALALAAARDGRRVLLVDADLRLPTQHARFAELRPSPGLVEVLTRAVPAREAIQRTAIDGLDLLAAGTLPPNPGQLVESLRMRQALLEVAHDYDLVIVDTPPVLAVNDAIVLSRAVDGLIVAIEAGRTTRRMLHEARARFEAAKITPLGAVLTKVRSGAHATYARYYQPRAAPEPAAPAARGGAA